MRKLILFFVVFGSFVFSQEKQFKISKEGMTDFVVVEKEGKQASEIYSKVIEWINRTYKNPKEVIKSEVKDEYVRFEGVKEGLYSYSILGFPYNNTVRYSIEILIKDGKYKFDIVEMAHYETPTKYKSGGWYKIDTSFFYKKNGELKEGYKSNVLLIPYYFNELNKSLSDYISSSKTERNDNW